MPQAPLPDQNHLFPENTDLQNDAVSSYTPILGIPEIQPPAPVVKPQQVIVSPRLPQSFRPAVPPQNYKPQNIQMQNGYYPNQYNNFAQYPNFPNNPQNPKKPVNKENKFTKFLFTKWWLVLILIFVICLGGVAAYFFVKSQTSLVPSGPFTNVEAKIEAPQTSPSGTPNKWKITIVNKESVALQNVVISLDFDRTFKFTRTINPDPSRPDGSEFKLARLEAVNQDATGTIIQFEGTLTGNTDEETLMQGNISYTPSVLQDSQGSRRTIPIVPAKTKITEPQISLNLAPTQDTVQNGGEAELVATLKNVSESELKDVRIRMQYPDKNGFDYKGSELQIGSTADSKTTPDNSNNIWNIGNMPRTQSYTLKVRGNVFGSDNVKTSFSLFIELKGNNNDYKTIAQTSRDIKISAQPLSLITKITNKDNDKTFNPGETLNVSLEYQNKSTTTLKNVELVGFLDDPANILDYTTIAFSGGDRGTLNNRTIQWKSNGVPQLANLSPQQRGQLSYSIRVSDKDTFVKSGLTQNTFTITPKATAKATNLQSVDFSGDLYKAKGLLEFAQTIKSKGLDETNKNKEVFTVTWTLTSRQTQVNTVQIRTSSPLGIGAWQPKSIIPATDSTKISYNEVTGEILWQPGNILPYTGTSTKPSTTISFDLVVESGGNTSKGILFDPAKVTGVDDFTSEKYNITGPAANAK